MNHPTPNARLPIVLGITGASGAAYGLRLLEVLLAAGETVYLSVSPSGQAVIEHELPLTLNLERFSIEQLLPALPKLAGGFSGTLHYCHHQDLLTPIASGSFRTRGMVICPCSGSTLAAIAHALGSNLIQRAAEVHLKERRKLILTPRETPLSLPQLENMLAVTRAGAVVLPASPGFYHGATTVDELVNFVVSRICDQLGLDNQLIARWGEAD